MKKNLGHKLAVVLLLFFSICFAQDKETAGKALTDYFFLERENIHLQTNKSIYLNYESVWFKGYVFHRRKNVPFFSTVNIFASLIDETGKVLETQLVYGNVGGFQGSFKLGSSLKSGRYYIQCYTNWMNNFTEDESAVAEFTVINQSTGAGTALSGPDTSKLNIDIAAEGGNFVTGVTNILSIHVSDCNHEPTEVVTADITDSAGNVLKKVQLNKLGYGRFDLVPVAGENYKAVVNYNDKTFEVALPAAASGITLEVNNYLSVDKTTVTIRTDNPGKYKSLLLLIHKDDHVNMYEVQPKGEIKLAIANADLAEGLNTIRLLDKDLNELAQRVIFKFPAAATGVTVNNDNENVEYVELTGKVNHPAMFNLSMTVLPENTLAMEQENDIYSSLWILPYIQTDKKARGKYYFNTISRAKAYELDMYLMGKTSKYNWNNILKNPPKSNYGFDMGLTLKGTLPEKLAGKTGKKDRIQLYSLTAGLNEYTTVDDKGNFEFDKLVIRDSTHVTLSLIPEGGKAKVLDIKPRITDGFKEFNKKYKPAQRCYLSGATTAPELPGVVTGTIELEETVINAKRLKYERSFGNGNLNGVKIGERETNAYHNVMQYIISRGMFNVDNGGIGRDAHIYSRQRNSLNAAQSEPIVYINNSQLLDHNQLTMISMDEVDEIYISTTALVPSVRNYSGVIKIYLKPAMAYTSKDKNATPDIIITDGFEKYPVFKNEKYNYNSAGFENFGVIDWQAEIMTDENGNFKFKIPNINRKKVKVLIEGFSADGKLISEIKTLELKQ
ncbi:hypothetical protein ACLI1A_16780 [Flavobacterium sp. RHBU_3]|uniref:hypothetical protein n=1 Tax=Flavobacterium sp. RHBU_3 TaxID=3391184 RepID=UPI003984FFD7